MDTYEEYVIRCKTCNEQIACFSSAYRTLINSGVSIEGALNELGIMEPCSRIAMMNPTIVAFNMENRAVIEGFKSVDTVVDDDNQEESTSQPIFSSCLGAGALNPTINPAAPPQIITGIQTTAGLRVPPNVPGLTTQQPLRPLQIPGLQTLGQVQPIIKPILQPITGAAIQPIVTGIKLDTDQPNDQGLGVGIPVNIPERMENLFQEPTIVGVPTINPDHTVQQATVFVGAGKYVNVLNGRTYLAQ